LPDGRTRPSGLGRLVADSVLTVRSAVRVASALHQMTSGALNRTTLLALALAQLTTELDDTRLAVNGRGAGKEWQTFASTLQRNAVAPAAVSNDQNLWMALGEVTRRGAPSRG
jgi:hypothetical protein